ncbi:tyrosine-type recombinase/integrase [Tateyamaria armeniaca]|uniref:Tyrosine-type recombinase/integrase n=1 Tax=Tateyamaria armeniaca TaxID=2518930 RepID=A0ABW8UXJ5_9RHOB
MPKIKFTDASVGAIPTPVKTTWFTDTAHKGLRLCVTKTGVKTWYVNKWDPTANKVRAVKLGQWSPKVTHCKWAKGQLGVVAHGIASGDVMNKTEAQAQEVIEQANALPAFREALEQFIEHRTTSRQSGKARMMETTAKDYRATFNKHLAQWADVHVDELPILEINQYLNAVQVTRPNAAHVAATVAGATVRFINKLCALALPIPSLLEGTKMRSRVETGKLDMQVPWSDRWDEIEAIPNEHIRLCWQITWYTGFRGRGLRALTWDQVDLEAGVVRFDRLKRQEVERTIVLADDVVSLFKRLHGIRYEDCDWVFPSRVLRCDKRGHLDVPDKLPLTKPGDLRHLWMTVAREVAPRHVHRWLSQQTMTDNDLRMLGHYGEPSWDEQKRAADAIAGAIKSRIGGESNVVSLLEARA